MREDVRSGRKDATGGSTAVPKGTAYATQPAARMSENESAHGTSPMGGHRFRHDQALKTADSRRSYTACESYMHAHHTSTCPRHLHRVCVRLGALEAVHAEHRRVLRECVRHVPSKRVPKRLSRLEWRLITRPRSRAVCSATRDEGCGTTEAKEPRGDELQMALLLGNGRAPGVHEHGCAQVHRRSWQVARHATCGM